MVLQHVPGQQVQALGIAAHRDRAAAQAVRAVVVDPHHLVDEAAQIAGARSPTHTRLSGTKPATSSGKGNLRSTLVRMQPNFALDAVAEIHVDGGAVEHVLRIAVADDGAIGPGAQAGHGHVGVAARGRDRVPDRLEDLQRVRRHFVVAVQPDDQLAARLAHAAVERRFLVLVVLPDIADGKSRARLPCQHRGVRVVRGAIIHHDPFEVLEGLLTERLVHPVQRARPVGLGSEW